MDLRELQCKHCERVMSDIEWARIISRDGSSMLNVEAPEGVRVYVAWFCGCKGTAELQVTLAVPLD